MLASDTGRTKSGCYPGRRIYPETSIRSSFEIGSLDCSRVMTAEHDSTMERMESRIIQWMCGEPRERRTFVAVSDISSRMAGSVTAYTR